MTDRIKVFFLTPTNLHDRALRRICSKDGCGWYMTATPIGRLEGDSFTSGEIAWDRADSRWPVKCEKCGEPFKPSDRWLVDHWRLYRRGDNDELVTLHDAPPGSCWDAHWYRDDYPPRPPGCGSMTGPDGRTLIVRCPDGHDWIIDSRASNCTKKDDNAHWCWVRHGKPEDGTLHVDKNGNTCSAGAGSIQTPHWHGFLHHGELHT